jgi:hypothetical protein
MVLFVALLFFALKQIEPPAPYPCTLVLTNSTVGQINSIFGRKPPIAKLNLFKKTKEKQLPSHLIASMYV